MADALEDLVIRQRRMNSDEPGPAGGDREDLHVDVRRNVNDPAGLQLAARMHHRFVPALTERAQQHDLGRRAGVACPEQAGTDDPRDVQGERVARLNKLSQVAELVVYDSTGVPVDDHESRCVPRRNRVLGDLAGRQSEVIVGRQRALHCIPRTMTRTTSPGSRRRSAPCSQSACTPGLWLLARAECVADSRSGRGRVRTLLRWWPDPPRVPPRCW